MILMFKIWKRFNGDGIKIKVIEKKQARNLCLHKFGIQQIFEKLRELRSISNTSAVTDLPTAVATLPGKMTRFFYTAQRCSDSEDEDVIAASVSSRPPQKFDFQDGVCLIKVFHSLIKNKTAGKKDIEKIVKVNNDAMILVEKHSLTTVQNQIKYEIRMRKKLQPPET